MKPPPAPARGAPKGLGARADRAFARAASFPGAARARRALLPAIAAFALAGAIGCASVPPPAPAPAVSRHPGGAGDSAPAGAAAATPSPRGAAPSSAHPPAVVDSGPSADAVAVLATIPEPLTPAERVPPPAAGAGSGAGAAAGGAAAAARAAEEALRAAAPAIVAEDTLIPVPAPTQPLGDRPGAAPRVLPDTIPALPPPAAAPPAAALPDSCWRVQVAAPTDREEADLKRQAAESVLLVPFEIHEEKTRFKVRNRDCLGRHAADQLRRRAISSGFEGSFPVLEVRK